MAFKSNLICETVHMIRELNDDEKLEKRTDVNTKKH